MNQVTTMPTIADAKKALSRMLNGFNWGGDENEKKLKLDAYWAVLGGLPPNVVVAACAAAARGELGDDKRFPPTAAKVYDRAVSYLPRPTFKLINPGRVIPQDERERVGAGFASFSKEMAQWNAEQEPERPPGGRWPVTARPLSGLTNEALARGLKK